MFKDSISLDDFYMDFSYSEPFYPRWSNILYRHPLEFYKVLSSAFGYWHKVVDKRVKPLVAILLLKIARYFSYSDEKVAKLYKSKFAKKD